MKLPDDLARRHILYLLKKVTTYSGSCWMIGNSPNTRYSSIKLEGKRYSVHRLSAYLFHGLNIDDESQQINHKVECSSSLCWNPDHLYIGTPSENTLDQVKKGTHKNANKTHCIHGHEYDQFKWKDGKIIARRCSQCRSITG